MKILITDPVYDYLITQLKNRNFKYNYRPGISREELLKIISDYNIVIVRGRTKIDKEVLDKATSLKAVIRFGVGLDNIDLEYCKKKGVKVFNTPEAFTEAVAELTIGLMIGILRGLGEAHRFMKKGMWEKKRFYGYELYGKNIAILGFGRIGRRVAELLMPFNVSIIAFVRRPIPDKYIKMGVKYTFNLMDAVRDADIITIHLPLTKETENLINYDVMKMMRRKPFIINTARGRIINMEDLKRALIEGLISGVALDVYYIEPYSDYELLKLDNVFLTPHIGAQTYEANIRASKEVIRILEEIKAKS